MEHRVFGVVMLVAALAACTPLEQADPGTDPGPDATTQVPVDCTEATSCEPGSVFTQDAAFAIHSLRFEQPERLANNFLTSQVDDALMSGRLAPVLSFTTDKDDGTPRLLAGPAVATDTCVALESRVQAAGTPVLVEPDGFIAEQADVHFLMRDDQGQTVLDVVLPRSRVQGDLSDDGLYIGAREATVTSIITVDETRDVPVNHLGVTLCSLLSGATGELYDLSDDCEGDPASWPTPPDASVDGQPAYLVSFTFQAHCVPLGRI